MSLYEDFLCEGWHDLIKWREQEVIFIVPQKLTAARLTSLTNREKSVYPSLCMQMQFLPIVTAFLQSF